MRSTQIKQFEGSKLTKDVTNLSSRDDNILAPVLDTHRSIGMHHGQIAAVKVPTLESVLSGLLICEILQDPKEKLSNWSGRGGSVRHLPLS